MWLFNEKMGNCQPVGVSGIFRKKEGRVLVPLTAMDEIVLFTVPLSGIWVYYKMISSVLCSKTSREVGRLLVLGLMAVSRKIWTT